MHRQQWCLYRLPNLNLFIHSEQVLSSSRPRDNFRRASPFGCSVGRAVKKGDPLNLVLLVFVVDRDEVCESSVLSTLAELFLGPREKKDFDTLLGCDVVVTVTSFGGPNETLRPRDMSPVEWFFFKLLLRLSGALSTFDFCNLSLSYPRRPVVIICSSWSLSCSMIASRSPNIVLGMNSAPKNFFETLFNPFQSQGYGRVVATLADEDAEARLNLITPAIRAMKAKKNRMALYETFVPIGQRPLREHEDPTSFLPEQ